MSLILAGPILHRMELNLISMGETLRPQYTVKLSPCGSGRRRGDAAQNRSEGYWPHPPPGRMSASPGTVSSMPTDDTDDEEECIGKEFASNGYPATTGICKGFGDGPMRASTRFHITSTDLNPASFPRLKGIATRKFCYGVAFHGFSKRPDNSDLYIGGSASDTLLVTDTVHESA
jgi:hypothetical protein